MLKEENVNSSLIRTYGYTFSMNCHYFRDFYETISFMQFSKRISNFSKVSLCANFNRWLSRCAVVQEKSYRSTVVFQQHTN